VPPGIRDHAVLEAASARLEELIEACRRGGGLHAQAPHLSAQVSRKAKSLRSSLTLCRRSAACCWSVTAEFSSGTRMMRDKDKKNGQKKSLADATWA
jgi:hypothetical protein